MQTIQTITDYFKKKERFIRDSEDGIVVKSVSGSEVHIGIVPQTNEIVINCPLCPGGEARLPGIASLEEIDEEVARTEEGEIVVTIDEYDNINILPKGESLIRVIDDPCLFWLPAEKVEEFEKTFGFPITRLDKYRGFLRWKELEEEGISKEDVDKWNEWILQNYQKFDVIGESYIKREFLEKAVAEGNMLLRVHYSGPIRDPKQGAEILAEEIGRNVDHYAQRLFFEEKLIIKASNLIKEVEEAKRVKAELLVAKPNMGENGNEVLQVYDVSIGDEETTLSVFYIDKSVPVGLPTPNEEEKWKSLFGRGSEEFPKKNTSRGVRP